jgi:hypothetical protein
MHNHNKADGPESKEKTITASPTESIEIKEGQIENATSCLRRGGSLLLLGPRWWYISLTRRIMARLHGSIENVLCTTAVSASDAQGWDRIGAQRVRTVRDEESFRRLLSIRYAQPNLDLSLLKCRRQTSLALMYGAMLGVAVATASGSSASPSGLIPNTPTDSPAPPPSSSIQTPSHEIWDDSDLVDDTADMSEDEEVEDGWITQKSKSDASHPPQPAEAKTQKPDETSIAKPKTIKLSTHPTATATVRASPQTETHLRILDHISHLVPQPKDDESLWALFGGGPILCMSRWLALFAPLCPPLCPPFSAPSESQMENHFDFLCQRALSSQSPIIVCEPSTTVISPVTLARFGAVLRFW